MALDYKLIGKRLQSTRVLSGYTQEELSEMIEVSVPYLSRIENGKTHINLKRLVQICEILEVSESFILNGVSDTSSNYLNVEFASILSDCSTRDKELIYQIASVISKNK